MSTKTDELSKILKDNFHRFVLLEGNSRYVNVPTFDLYPRDYLGYAENGITNGDTKKLIECVGHLKRAVDCQIDVFLSVFGFSKYFKKWKLGIDKKLDFYMLLEFSTQEPLRDLIPFEIEWSTVMKYQKLKM